MFLYIDYKNHWHLKDEDNVDVIIAKNDSEKVELVGRLLQEQREEIQAIKYRLEVK
jgi:hypothetical protein